MSNENLDDVLEKIAKPGLHKIPNFAIRYVFNQLKVRMVRRFITDENTGPIGAVVTELWSTENGAILYKYGNGGFSLHVATRPNEPFDEISHVTNYFYNWGGPATSTHTMS